MLLLILALLGAAGCASVGSAPQPAAPARFLNHDPSTGYVGRETCAFCHFSRFATYAGVGMGRSFHRLTPATAVEDFTEHNELVDDRSGVRYRMTEREGRFYQRQFLVDSQGREVASDEHELVYVIGSNNHGRGYVVLQNGALFQAPVCWDPTERMWILCPGFEHDNHHFTREISSTCVFCHNGRMELLPGERNRYREPIPHGIDCERCHGPGQLHVERWLRGGAPPLEGSAQDIVNPGSLPPGERIQICAQCHLGDSSATVRVIRHDRDLSSFRPGQPLTEVVVPLRYVQPTRYDFGIASQADRLLLSRCYTASGGRMDCLGCHNPHVTVYREGRQEFFRERCLDCHEPGSCAAPREARDRTEPPDDCVGCHMRRGEAVDRRHAQFTDHWIQRAVLHERDRRTSYELEPVFPEAWAALPAAERAYYGARANFLRAIEEPPRARPELWARAERGFREALEQGFQAADAWFFLGKTHMFQGRWPEAEAAFENALDRDPDHHDAAFALGQSRTALGEFPGALEVFRAMLVEDPSDPMALAEYGRTCFALGRQEEALDALRRAVAEEPWSATLRVNLGMALAASGRLSEALAESLDAVRLDPDGSEAWEFRANALRAAGQPAAEALGQLGRLRGRDPRN